MTDLDPVALEVARHALSGVAEEMGTALRRSAFSPNIKERADCSAAVFAPDGTMVAQAEHIPVHLGAMPASVTAVLAAHRALRGGPLPPGWAMAVNDPYAGGTHLPDLTIVTGVGDDAGRLLGYVANRAHHADVGGAAPGSMSATATDIAMEGLRVPPVVVVDDDGPRTDVLGLIAAGSRTPDERWGDLRAQLAANHVGARRLRELATTDSVEALHRAMTAVCDHAERRVRAAVRAMPDGTWSAVDLLESAGDAEIHATVTIDGDQFIADLSATAAQVQAPCNAVRAVTVSAAQFVLRMLADPDAPANDGALRCLTVRTRPGTLVDARFPAPVATGNVETGQRIVDVLLAALAPALPDRVPAASQGTMNNLLIGAAGGAGAAYGYYETIGGGEGATPWRDGMSGVHTAMTNTRNTPAEAMELAYPLRVWRSELRSNSGGRGHHVGGDGTVREVELLADATVTLQTERRARGPWGLAGGEPGAPGRNTLVHQDGSEETLPAMGTWALRAGERIRVETPGGGGWGPPS